MNVECKGLEFTKTCERCPEQYEVKYDGKEVGYVRLRWGWLTVNCPDAEGKEVYAEKLGDDFMGEFADDRQRFLSLNEMANVILRHIFFEEGVQWLREKIVDYLNEERNICFEREEYEGAMALGDILDYVDLEEWREEGSEEE